MKKKSHLFRGAASIFLALLLVFGIAGEIAGNWAGKVNELLGVSESTIKRSENPEDYRFTSDYSDPSDLIQAEIGLNTRLAAEGSVVLKGVPKLDGTKVSLFGMRSGEKMQFGGSMGELTDASNTVTLADAMADNGFRKQSSQDEEKVSPHDDLFGLTQVGSVDFRHHLFDTSFFHQVRQVIGIFLVAIGYHNFRQGFSDFWKLFHFCINFGKNTEFFPFS